MVEINPYYLEEATLSNLDRIFNSADIPFIRLSKFLDLKSVIITSKFEREEKIGYFKQELFTYGRTGAECKVCMSPIRQIVLSGRSSFYCVSCQY